MDVMTDIALEPDAGPGRRVRFESRPNAAIAARAAGVPVLDVVIPVYNEQATLADSVYRLHRHLRDQFPFPARITIADNASVDDTPRIAQALAAELDRRPGGAPRAEGPRPRAALGVVDLRRPGARVHGRRPVDRPRSTRPARRAADIRPLRPRHRHPAGPRSAGGARPEARDHLALLQPDPEIHPRRGVLRCAVRFQGDPRRRRAAPASAHHRHRVVLRHRAAGVGRAHRPAHPRSPRGLGRRSRQPGRHRGHRDRRSQGHRAAAARLRQGLHTGANACGAARFVASRRGARVAAAPIGAVRQRRGRLHARPTCCCSCCCTGGLAPRPRT